MEREKRSGWREAYMRVDGIGRGSSFLLVLSHLSVASWLRCFNMANMEKKNDFPCFSFDAPLYIYLFIYRCLYSFLLYDFKQKK